jgi:HAD superfamily hydrolase (TIGR01509 family)
MTDLLIYDCDGTLVDSERLVADVCLAEIHRLGLTDWTMDRYVEAFVGMPGHVGWGTVWTELDRDMPHGFSDMVDARILESFATSLELLPDTRATVAALELPRCVASSTRLDHLQARISQMGLDDLFGGNIFSVTQVKRAKPAPDVFLYAASQMGHDPARCIVIEDSVPGVTAAVRAGMHVIGFTGAAHDPALMAAKLVEAGASRIARHMRELPALVHQVAPASHVGR